MIGTAGQRLDRFLPSYHFSEVHEAVVRASVTDTYAALRALRPRDVPTAGLLMSLRRLPARLLGRRVPSDGDDEVPILEGIGRRGCLTETRIQATDAASERKFGLYWLFAQPGSALIRRVWLRAVRKRAEAGRKT